MIYTFILTYVHNIQYLLFFY